MVSHSFDVPPAHLTVSAAGQGSTLRSACCAAIRKMLSDKRLSRRHVSEFKIIVVVQKGGAK